MESQPQLDLATGFPELTELGKRIEMFRIERGIAKQHLARRAGTSRQQLWRVMTGKSELSAPLRLRLSEVLQVPTAELVETPRAAAHGSIGEFEGRGPLASYLGDAAAIERTLATMPAGDAGRGIKRRLLDALEDTALAAGCTLDGRFFELRRRVLAGQL
jgi:transcriptional regulator with XRE-family HTH domain